MKRLSQYLTSHAVTVAAGLLFVLLILAIATDRKDWWGISSITYLSPFLKSGLALLALVCLLASLLGFFAKLPGLKRFSRYAWLLLLALTVGLFVLREALPLLGDGWLLIGLTEHCASSFPVWTYDRPEPLGLVFFASIRLLSGLDSQTLYQVISVLAAVVILLAFMGFGHRLKMPAEYRWLLGVPLFTSASLTLFAGYIESYPLLVAIWTLLLLYAAAGIQERSLPFWPLLAAVPVLFFWHYLSLILFPVIAFTGVLRLRKTELTAKNFIFSLSGIFALLLLIYLLTPLRDGVKWILPLLPAHTFDGYSLLSLHHLTDLLWELILAAPLAPFFVLTAWMLRRDLGRDAGFQILALAALLGLAAAFVFDPELGMARDWDLLATMFLPLNIWAGYAMAKVKPSLLLRRRIAGVAFVPLLTVALPLIIVNHRADLSMKRFETLLSVHPERSAYGWEILAETVGRGDPKTSLTYLENASKVSTNPRYLQNIAALALELGQREKAYRAVSKLRDATPRNFLEANAYFFFFLEFAFLDNAERMIPFLEKLAPTGEDLTDHKALLAQVKSDLARQRTPK
ncbi:MAG: hypothetical protein V1784_11580 [bacterium]